MQLDTRQLAAATVWQISSRLVLAKTSGQCFPAGVPPLPNLFRSNVAGESGTQINQEPLLPGRLSLLWFRNSKF